MSKTRLTESELRYLIRTAIKELLDDEEEDLEEVSQTGDVAGFNIPHAFAGGDTSKRKKISKQAGYELLDEPEKGNPEELKEARSQYYNYKNDDSMNTRQKIGTSLRTALVSLKEAEKLVNMNIRLKKETGITSDRYWKRAHKYINEIEKRALNIMTRIKHFRD